MTDKKQIQPNYFPNVHNIALFLDLDNFSLSGKRGREIATLVNALKPWGNVALGRAYGCKSSPKKYLYPQLLDQQFAIHEINSDSGGKNGTDMRIAIEIMELLHTRPGIEIFAIASGDSDYLGLVTRLHQYRRLVIGLGSKKNTSRRLHQSCDVFLFYENMNGNSSGEDVVACSSKLRCGSEAVRSLLRKRCFYPPEPQLRRRILQEITRIDLEKHNYDTLQQELFQRLAAVCSKKIVRNSLHCLLKTGLLVSFNEGLPLKQRAIITLPEWQAMEQAIVDLQIGCVVEDPNVVIDPLAIAEVVWGDSRRAPELEKILQRNAATIPSDNSRPPEI